MRISVLASRGVRLLRVWVTLLCLGTLGVSVAATSTDVRVLIDVSGSMRQNDPDNLRRPALRMLAGLLQPDTRAGVWTFARQVNNLVPVAGVDARWKARAQSLSEKIGSPGQFTNIEEVLDRASRDWTGIPDGTARHLVLLTDGMVDVAKDPQANARSRARILDALLPRLKEAGVRVHTIALSERADHELMERLAGETGGWYQQVERADELQRVFLRMFEQVGSPDTVPLDDNRFTVDGSVSEATVLVFSRPDAKPVVLRSPAGEEYRDSDLVAGVAWYRDTGYDLVTIASPQKGEWALDADLDPDNRVMIVTDLRLQTSEIPTHIAVGEQARVEAHLTNRGDLVDRQAFLRLLDVRADAEHPDGREVLDLNDRGEGDDELAADGRYTARYGESRARDQVSLVIGMDSPTFMREKRFRMKVHEPAVGTVTQDAVLTIRGDSAVLQAGARVEAWQLDPAGERTTLALSETDAGDWMAPLVDPGLPAFFGVTGTSRLGNPLEFASGPLVMPGVEIPEAVAAAPTPEVAGPAPPVDTAVELPAAEPDETAAVPPDAGEAEAEPDWVLPGVLFGGVNLLLLIGAGAWWFLRRRRARVVEEAPLADLIEVRTAGSGSDAELVEEEAPVQEDAA